MTMISDGIKDVKQTPAVRKTIHGIIYECVLGILGSTGTIVPIGDINNENSARTTVTTKGGETNIFTYSKAITAFDKPPYFKGPSGIPMVPFNGIDEESIGVDSNYWSRGNGATDSAFSVGAWVNVVDSIFDRTILGRWDLSGGGNREWLFEVGTTDKLVLFTYDESVNQLAGRTSNAAITMGSLRFFVGTYDGTGGPTAANGMTLYDNGSLLGGTATNSGTYVAMENLVKPTTLGSFVNASGTTVGLFNGEMAGGPLAPFFVHKELTADEVLRLYRLGQTALDI